MAYGTKRHEKRFALRYVLLPLSGTSKLAEVRWPSTFVLLLFSVEKAVVPKVYGIMHVSNLGLAFR